MTAIPVTRLDHSACEHPRTKAGRAACRKAMREAEAPAECVVSNDTVETDDGDD